MGKIVLDTSVVVKWFSLEENREQALKIRDGIVQGKINLVEPELIFYELINALWFGKRISTKKIAKILGELGNLEPRIVSIYPKLLSETLKLVKQFPITAYDASFIALANLQKIPLVSADTEHHKKNYSKFIIPLTEF